jgi:hypothetical protein
VRPTIRGALLERLGGLYLHEPMGVSPVTSGFANRLSARPSPRWARDTATALIDWGYGPPLPNTIPTASATGQVAPRKAKERNSARLDKETPGAGLHTGLGPLGKCQTQG